ncbi:ATPase [Trypanosoma cruzi]|uniref:ATPase n=1 Tax=Trypanosoma cruzi TaxID=5693 RepID=A0A7J6XQU3_TRYCR|nr:ATPase [Trypanosoma cruzi]KAF5218818.1 ATPase [Trypanosoma cruzi]
MKRTTNRSELEKKTENPRRVKQPLVQIKLQIKTTATAAPRSRTPPPLFCFFFFLLRVRLLLRWWPRESEGERAMHRPHTHSSFTHSLCVPLHGLSPSPHPTKHTHNVPIVYIACTPMHARWCSLLHHTHRCRPAWLHGRSTVTVFVLFFYFVFISHPPIFFFFFLRILNLFSCLLLFLLKKIFFSNLSTPLFCFWGNHHGRFFFFIILPSLIVSCCTLPARGAVCFPPNCSTRTPTDALMTTALCASPAARMRRGRDERRAEGAVTCGRATRACGAEHTFLPLLFCFCGQGGQTPAAPHTHTPCRRVFFFFCFLFCGRVCAATTVR